MRDAHRCRQGTPSPPAVCVPQRRTRCEPRAPCADRARDPERCTVLAPRVRDAHRYRDGVGLLGVEDDESPSTPGSAHAGPGTGVHRARGEPGPCTVLGRARGPHTAPISHTSSGVAGRTRPAGSVFPVRIVCASRIRGREVGMRRAHGWRGERACRHGCAWRTWTARTLLRAGIDVRRAHGQGSRCDLSARMCVPHTAGSERASPSVCAAHRSAESGARPRSCASGTLAAFDAGPAVCVPRTPSRAVRLPT